MNRTRLLMIGGLALALGALVSVLVYKNLQGRGPSTGEPGADVIVALDDIQVGARIEDHDIRIAKFPVSGLPAGAYARKSQVLGRGVIIPITKGEFILPSKLAPVREPALTYSSPELPTEVLSLKPPRSCRMWL